MGNIEDAKKNPKIRDLSRFAKKPQPSTDEALREKARLTDEEIEGVWNEVEKLGKAYAEDEITNARAIAKAQQDKDFTLLQQRVEQERERIKEWLEYYAPEYVWQRFKEAINDTGD